jgi:hypothetical protein
MGFNALVERRPKLIATAVWKKQMGLKSSRRSGGNSLVWSTVRVNGPDPKFLFLKSKTRISAWKKEQNRAVSVVRSEWPVKCVSSVGVRGCLIRCYRSTLMRS